ncbi:MAG: Ribosomal RNA small subunit methyltransferase D [Chroococcopsis gigantea SAG 12.99]|jgi:16S rRNA (guanine966-N2)-methyltransferase|nr:16S rRNA (guanine(966)-N(2))-methyltransferase RsmD [Chlorogloea purpurea SAG 13.99]MDV3002234.1 Ribosomal RNA small subunit methyltransferase D [Chroococcopsis gigantea SAG 12.99]
MRIYGNRSLKTVTGELTRPTTSRVREALFNMWREDLDNCHWLDLCAGNGTMGAEALCRGAKLVVGIEKYGKACSVIEQNWQMVATSEQEYRVIRGDVVAGLGKLGGVKFARIYFDPPYESGLYLPVLQRLGRGEILSPSGEIAVEHDRKSWQASEIEGLELIRQKSYGNTELSFYTLDTKVN